MRDLSRAPQLLADLMAIGFQRAGDHLSGLLGWSVRIDPPDLAFLPLSQACAEFSGEDDAVVAIHTAFSGDLSGQVLLLLEPERAATLASLCLGEVPGQAADPALAASVLSEVGNIAGAAVLNAAADHFGLTVTISPPQVVNDMAGAILGSVLPLVESLPDRVLVMRTEFSGADAGVAGAFLLLPDAATLARLVDLTGVSADG